MGSGLYGGNLVPRVFPVEIGRCAPPFFKGLGYMGNLPSQRAFFVEGMPCRMLTSCALFIKPLLL